MSELNTFCAACGYLVAQQARRRADGSCTFCGCTMADTAAIAAVEKLPPDTPLLLRCTVVLYVQTGERLEQGHTEPCTGTLAFTVADLKRSVAVAGNGPRSYRKSGRFKLQGRCSSCEGHSGPLELLLSNREVLAALQPPSSENPGGRPMTAR